MMRYTWMRFGWMFVYSHFNSYYSNSKGELFIFNWLTGKKEESQQLGKKLLHSSMDAQYKHTNGINPIESEREREHSTGLFVHHSRGRCHSTVNRSYYAITYSNRSFTYNLRSVSKASGYQNNQVCRLMSWQPLSSIVYFVVVYLYIFSTSWILKLYLNDSLEIRMTDIWIGYWKASFHILL